MKSALGFSLALAFCATPALSERLTDVAFQQISETVFGPVIDAFDIPGMAIGVTYRGETYIYTYGVAVRETAQPVTPDTLFELGSVSKLFSVALAGLADARGVLSLERPVSDWMPDIKGSAFDTITLYDLAAHANGGLPLQVPAQIRTDADLTRWLADWTTDGDPRHIRSYSNLSIGLLGKITGEAFGSDYDTALKKELLPALGLESTYVTVPEAAMQHYAFGYDRFGDSPVRVGLNILDAEAYGLKSSLTDMIRFLETHLGLHPISAEVAAALARTRAARYDTAHYAQAMVWEEYVWPVTAEQLAAGNSRQMALAPQPITERDAPLEGPMFLNKTGATNGFGAYVAMVPEEEIGVVVLANRYYPNPVRARATLELITAILDAE
ncbi:class C beta-lactamase [uncultured Tateyamaria sp.]|uniref:class C beta-lactamase n=1 Tax=uncultured Tateyamaria sp. TaxID=455651 RepID=UPI002625C2E9|nr:class C beta-lactamase [uncultured Tateyamaria sp.]